MVSLARELREALEARLQKGNLPTTAVCTMTLELGIDIGRCGLSQVTPSAFCFQSAPTHGTFGAARFPIGAENVNY